MSKIRFDVCTWIQKLPTSAYTFNGRSVRGGTGTLLKVIPVNDNTRPPKHKVVNFSFSINRWFLTLMIGTFSVMSVTFVALLIFFFKNF